MNSDSVVRTISWLLMMGRAMLSGATTLTPALDAEVLLGKVLALSRTQLLVHSDRLISDDQYRAYMSLLEKRAEGMPVAYITGRREFMSVMFAVDQRCLIPRPETEVLVEKVLEFISRTRLKNPEILELGTGSGCISVALALNLHDAVITATDVSTGALEVARLNADNLGVTERIDFLAGDLYDALGEKSFNIIVSNPPYIAEDEISQLPRGVKEYEPSQALWTGEDGLAIIRRIIEGAHRHLKNEGLVALEINPRKSRKVRELFRDRGFCAVHSVHDLAGYERVMVAERKGDDNGE